MVTSLSKSDTEGGTNLWPAELGNFVLVRRIKMNILSWNIKSFVTCVQFSDDGLAILIRVMSTFDLIVIYEVTISDNATKQLTRLKDLLNTNDPSRAYTGFVQ